MFEDRILKLKDASRITRLEHRTFNTRTQILIFSFSINILLDVYSVDGIHLC
jgi:hypothetical protein